MIRPITAEESLDVRHPVLRPGRRREDAVFESDEDARTRHFGAFDAVTGALAGVVTVHPAPWPGEPVGAARVEAWQLRGLATLPAVRGRGYGVALVKQVHQTVREAGGDVLWCNARVAAVPFYERLGWMVVGGEFDIPTVGAHFRMIRRI